MEISNREADRDAVMGYVDLLLPIGQADLQTLAMRFQDQLDPTNQEIR